MCYRSSLKAISLLAVIASMLIANSPARAQLLISKWDFENATLSGTPSTTSGFISASYGSGQALGVHALSSTFGTPTGNGSAQAFNSLHWTVGDYYQFQVSTVGYTDIQISFNQISSTHGPSDFKFAYSLNGTDFTDFDNYTVLENADPNTWHAGIAVISTSFAEDLSAISELSDASTVYFRLIDTSTHAADGGTVATSGGSRVDNFSVYGNLLVVPEPSSVALAGIASLLLLTIHRRRAQRS